MEDTDAAWTLCNHGDAVILPRLAIETLGRVQGAILRDRDVGYILLIDDKEPSTSSGRAGPILGKHLPDVRTSYVLLRVEHQRSGGRSPAINGRRLFDKQTEIRGANEFCPFKLRNVTSKIERRRSFRLSVEIR